MAMAIEIPYKLFCSIAVIGIKFDGKLVGYPELSSGLKQGDRRTGG